jgi:hypothetical protein
MGISSRIGTIAIGKQSAKGTPASVPTVKFRTAGAPSIMPIKDRARLNMTDSGRDGGDSYTSQMRIEGSFPVYMHPDGLGMVFGACLGTVVESGTTPNYTHTITPGNDMLWVTIWRMVGGVITERYEDCKITSIQIESTAGSPPVMTIGVIGLTATFEATDTVLSAITTFPYLHMDACNRIKFDTIDYRIGRVSLGIENGAAGFQADCYTFSDIDPGNREVTLAALLRFGGPTTFPKYREHYYGSDAGTTLSAVVATHAFEITYYSSANLSCQILLPQVRFAAVPVNADPGGDPIEIDLTTIVEKPAASPIMSVVIKDQKATFDV